MATITTRGPELFAGSRFTWHLTADQTGGQASLAEVLVRPGAEPPVHVHAREDEAYIVLEGEVTFLRGSETIDVGAGEAVFLPRGLQHGFAVRTPIARLMFLCTPGGLEKSFDRISQPSTLDLPPVPEGPPSQEEQVALAGAFESAGVTFTGPPLSVMLAA